ncbi:YdbH domain-containing protein [Stutzerimonas zhaodongensis]|uniref:YdbH domain-containing protein n=1 Tax=Stutzerimonas TaxID=2901164 RepID=UPI00388E5DE5
MTKLRTICLLAVLPVLLIVLVAGLYGGYRWHQFKHQQGIEALDFDGLRLSTRGLGLRHFALLRRSDSGEQIKVQLENVSLAIHSWTKPLPIRTLAVDHLHLEWQTGPTKPNEIDKDSAFELPSRQDFEDWARWLPRTGLISSFDLALPCARGSCQEQGEMRWQLTGDALLPAELSVTLRHETHRLALLTKAYERNKDIHLDVQLLLDDAERVSLQNQFSPNGATSSWRGTLAMNELPEAPWLLDWLGDWTTYTPPTLPKLPQQMRIGAGWALALDANTPLESWQTLDGELRLSVNLPAPWPVVGIGLLQGQLDLGARVESGAWVPTDLSSDLTLQPSAALLEDWPAQLRPNAISLAVTPAPATEPTQALRLNMQLAASGPSPLSLDTHLVLTTVPPYEATFDKTRLQLRNLEWAGPDIRLKGVEADLRLNGQASREGASIRVEKGSRLTVNSLSATPDITLDTLQVDLAGLGVDAGFTEGQVQRLAVKGNTALAVNELNQPALRPQGWRWSGALDGNLERISLDGPLGNDAGLTLPLALTYNLTNRVTRLDLRLPELFLRAGNPLAATLADWPRVLELISGRLQGKAQLSLPAEGPLAATATVSAKGLGGIYDRTELNGLDTELAIALKGDQLRLDVSELTLREANPGFTFGPLQFKGEFAGPVDSLAQGRLAWDIAEVRLLGGRLWLKPGAVDLTANTQQLTAHLSGLQLPLLLEAYPAEGLSGTGVIDGQLQVQRGEAGISIQQGSLKAREPGGALQFRSPKIQALGQANPAMRLVTEALDDFHYDLLASDVHYADDGTLNLGLKLHGRNPALEGGRPINFSINLEEDIPALLTSLQLSDRVSETIQRRVQERLR